MRILAASGQLGYGFTVSGSRFVRARPYTVKWEGVESLGYRMIYFAGIRDPVFIGCIDEFVSSCHQRAGDEARNLGFAPEAYQLSIKIYGRDAIMGEREPVTHGHAHEVAVLADVVAADEKTARAVIAKARYALLHTDFPGRQCIAGNLAIPFSPSDLSAGQVYGFNVWHTVAVDDPLALFPISYQDCSWLSSPNSPASSARRTPEHYFSPSR